MGTEMWAIAGQNVVLRNSMFFFWRTEKMQSGCLQGNDKGPAEKRTLMIEDGGEWFERPLKKLEG
jgi:hypothetical protein